MGTPAGFNKSEPAALLHTALKGAAFARFVTHWGQRPRSALIRPRLAFGLEGVQDPADGLAVDSKHFTQGCRLPVSR
jgi:hypothetical protein